MCHMVDRILDSVDESQFLNTLISEISVDNKGSGLTLRLVTDSERMRYNIDFNKKKHLIPVITGDNVPAIIKLYNQETSYDGDSYDNEVKGYVKAMENNIPTPRLICFGVLESGVEYIVSEYIPGETLNEAYSFIDNAIELLEKLHIEAGILHGDPDTCNFIVSYNNQVYICDFARCKPNPTEGRVYIEEINVLKSFLYIRQAYG